MDKDLKRKLAEYLDEAERNSREVVKITASLCPELTIKEAYEVQNELIKLKEARGQKVLAPKMGITSRAKMMQMNIEEPVYGFLFEYMLEEETLSLAKYIHPKVEPEIGIVLKEDVEYPVTLEEIENKVDYIFSCAEIVDSRYKNFEITLPDIIADNASAKGAFFGKEKFKLSDLDLINEEVKVLINGQEVASGKGAAILGNPLESILELAKMLSRQGEVVEKNKPIMSGALTASQILKAGDKIEIIYSNLEKISFKVEE